MPDMLVVLIDGCLEKVEVLEDQSLCVRDVVEKERRMKKEGFIFVPNDTLRHDLLEDGRRVKLV